MDPPPPPPAGNKRASVTISQNNPMFTRSSSRSNPQPPQTRAPAASVAGGDIALALMQDRVNQGMSALPTNVVRSVKQGQGASKRSSLLSQGPRMRGASNQDGSGRKMGGITEDVEASKGAPELPEGWTEETSEDGTAYFYNESANLTQWTHPAFGEDEEIPVDLLDPSMIFSLERTTLSGYNQSFSMMMIGAGIMTVKNSVLARNEEGNGPVDMGVRAAMRALFVLDPFR